MDEADLSSRGLLGRVGGDGLEQVVRHPPVVEGTGALSANAFLKIPQDSSRFLKIPLSDLYAGRVRRLEPLAPPCFLFVIFPACLTLSHSDRRAV